MRTVAQACRQLKFVLGGMPDFYLLIRVVSGIDATREHSDDVFYGFHHQKPRESDIVGCKKLVTVGCHKMTANLSVATHHLTRLCT